jgi:hypothetical protein
LNIEACVFALAASALLVAPITPAYADQELWVSDASQVKYSIYEGKIWFRNTDELDTGPDHAHHWAACCYYHYVDLSTDEGKAIPRSS